MTLSQRLRTCARHTGLDAVIELLQEAADEIDALQARAQVQGEPVGEIKWAANVPNSIREAVFYDLMPLIGTKLYTAPQPAHATQAEVTDERAAFEEWATNEGKWPKAVDRDHNGCYLLLQTSYAWTVWQARAILTLRPERVPMTDELFDLICNAIDKADTITMEGDYMLDSDDCIAVVRVMQALLSVRHGITAQAKKEGV